MMREHPSHGFLFESSKVDGARMWNRTRLGFPLGAVTIDTRLCSSVVQERVKAASIVLNL